MKSIIAYTILAALGLSSSANAADLSGTWNVTIKPGQINTCNIPANKTPFSPKVSVLQWLIADNKGALEVTVVGDWMTKALTGTATDKAVEMSVYNLAGVGENRGERRASLFADLAPQKDGSLAGTIYYVAYFISNAQYTPIQTCLVSYEATAKH